MLELDRLGKVYTRKQLELDNLRKGYALNQKALQTIFPYGAYKAKRPDLQEFTHDALLEHYLRHGIHEGTRLEADYIANEHQATSTLLIKLLVSSLRISGTVTTKRSNFNILALDSNDTHPLSLSHRGFTILNEDAFRRKILSLEKCGIYSQSEMLFHAERIGSRISRKLASSYHSQLGIPESALFRSWKFLIHCELATLIPIRHLARKLVVSSRGELIFIPLKSDELHYFCYWEDTEFFLLVLAAEIKRRGGIPILLVPFQSSSTHASKNTLRRIRLTPSPQQWMTGCTLDKKDNNSVRAVVPAGIRGMKVVNNIAPSALHIDSGFDAEGIQSTENISLLPVPPQMPTIELYFSRLPDSEFGPKSFSTVLSAHLDISDIYSRLIEGLAKTTAEASRNAHRICDDFCLNELHICDHVFFESALLADAVKARSGKVILWPHSSNPADVTSYDRTDFDTVYVATRNAAERWLKTFHNIDIKVRSETLFLVPPLQPQVFNREAPLTIVIFAVGLHFGRIFSGFAKDIGSLRRTYIDLFTRMSRLNPQCRVIFKARDYNGETFAWIRALVPDILNIEETELSSKLINEPNMIFMSVNSATTALLEGLSRGIPCMIASEAPHELMTNDEIASLFDPSVIPISTVSETVDILASYSNLGNLESHSRRQLDWFRAQTNFLDVNRAE